MRRDDGASFVMVAVSLLLLLGVAAIAVDLGGVWLDRSADQSITDSAAAAGALELVTADGQAGCETALDYVTINSDEIGSIDTSGCIALAGVCDPATAINVNVPTGRYDITITFPVPNGNDLMTSGIVGAGSQTVTADDGSPCDRLGVQMKSTRQNAFAQVLGFSQSDTSVHTVAIAEMGTNAGVPLNLLVLDRTGCQAILAQGNGGIFVDAVIAVDSMGNPTGLVPGIMASDSDGSAGCSSAGTIYIDGNNARIRADGPQGCATETGTHTVGAYTAGEGCGRIQTLAPGTPGCNEPACTPGAGGGNPPVPDPTALPQRLTRSPIDHKYNCWGNYASPPVGVSWASAPMDAASGQDIPGCSGGTDHIYDLINLVGQNGPVGGFSAWNADLGHPCLVPSSNPGITVPAGTNVRVDCPTFTVQTDVRINGNVVFDGHVNVTSGSADLNINNPPGSPGWAFFRNGTLTKDGQAHLTINHTAVYLSRTSTVNMSGGTGSLTWVAPNTGMFDDLALWSDSPSTHFWAGQANLVMEGVFFTPWALSEYSGTSGQNQTDAQWVAHRLTARGQGKLVISPAIGRAVPFVGLPESTLIR